MYAGDIVVEGSHEHGCKIRARVSGWTKARVTRKGWDGPGRKGEPELHEKVITTSNELLTLLGSIEHYTNLELVTATLETDEA